MKIRHEKKKGFSGRVKLAAAFLVMAVLPACILAEGEEYVIQPNPPNGIHVTIRQVFGEQLRLASVVIAAGVNIDAILAERGIPTTDKDNYNLPVCPSAIWPTTQIGSNMGDLCAFNILGVVKLAGLLDSKEAVPLVLGHAGGLVWKNATNPGEFEDFRDDTMQRIHDNNARCIHMTWTFWFIWPFGPYANDYNWTFREHSDPVCQNGPGGGSW